jgi:DNA-directed RNA polymerase subunit RPC12/RpoP
MSTNLSRSEREGLLQNQLSRDADSGHIQYSCLYCGRDDFRRLQSLRTHMNVRCRRSNRNDRDHMEEPLNGEVELEQVTSSSSSTVVEQLIQAAGLLESGGRYIVGSKGVQTSAAASPQHASFSNSPNIRAPNDSCIPDAKFGLINEQYSDDRSKIISFSCHMCEHRFLYTGRRTLTRHIHACCDKHPVKAHEFGLATGTCMPCLRGKPCERKSTAAAAADTTPTTTSGSTMISLEC